MQETDKTESATKTGIEPGAIATGAVQHCTLTVSDVARAAEFYVNVLGFQRAMEQGARVMLGNGSVLLTLTPRAPMPVSADADEQGVDAPKFRDESRVGLDDVSFTVASRRELEAALQLMDVHGIVHGEIRDLGPDLGIYMLSFRDPDGIQLELAAPYDL